MSAARTGPTPPGGVLGVVGGGQLGRMLALAAARLGLKTAVYAPEAEGPAQSVAAWSTVGAFEDVEALSAFARRVDVVTYEFENAPAGPLAAVDRITPVRPHPRALEAAQDRLVEKTRLNAIGVPTAPFAPVDGPEALAALLADPEGPAEAFLKTRRFGYDGKGQARL